MCSLYAEMWFRLVERGSFDTTFRHRTETKAGLKHPHAHHSLCGGALHERCPRRWATWGQPSSRLQITNWYSGGSAVAVESCVESCVFLEYACCHMSTEKKRILEKGAKKKNRDERIYYSQPLSLHSLFFLQFSTAWREPVSAHTQVS